MIRIVIALLIASLLSACATRGTLDVACADLKAVQLPKSDLVSDIQSGAGSVDVMGSANASLSPAGSITASPPASLSEAATPAATLAFQRMTQRLGTSDTLLLSGGGQWGAFGAGYLARLDESGNLPEFGTVTGVSTGALQALFIGALGDPALGDVASRRRMFQLLMTRYRPRSEDEVVDRDAHQLFSIATGSFAGLGPLRRRIALALCDDETAPTKCEMLRHIAASETRVLLGFVRADDGLFYMSDISEIARMAYPEGSNGSPSSPDALAEAQRCTIGAALASAAMPVTFQQVRVGPEGAERTFYDGGVRQSVFEAGFASLVRKSPDKGIAPPTVFVLRNGPTTVEALPEDDAINKKGNVFAPAMRAQSIVVNQLEVQSIADLRLARPRGPIVFMTADGYDVPHSQPGDDPALADAPFYSAATDAEQCFKTPKDAMFSPSFMACLMRYGRKKADDGWRVLRELKLPDVREELRE